MLVNSEVLLRTKKQQGVKIYVHGFAAPYAADAEEISSKVLLSDLKFSHISGRSQQDIS